MSCLQYEDPEGILLPPTLSAMGEVSWKRPFDLPTIAALSVEVRYTLSPFVNVLLSLCRRCVWCMTWSVLVWTCSLTTHISCTVR